MDKIVEEVLTSLIKRVEVLEEMKNIFSKRSPPKEILGLDNTNKVRKPGMMSQGQIDFIEGLGGSPDPLMTMKQASDYIEELKNTKDLIKKEDQMAQKMVKEFGDKEPLENTPKPLSKEEIKELEKKGALL